MNENFEKSLQKRMTSTRSSNFPLLPELEAKEIDSFGRIIFLQLKKFFFFFSQQFV